MPSTAKILPVQSRALKTRTALLEAVEALVVSEGEAAVTTTRIAQETGVAVGTIYRYFTDRNALLLAAYDANVSRVVSSCARALQNFDANMSRDEAATHLLSLYLDTAAADVAHSGLLSAMRKIRPIDADQAGDNETTIISELLLPFWRRFAPANEPEPDRLHFLSVLLGTLVDLWLMMPDRARREALRPEVEAHMQLALARVTKT